MSETAKIKGTVSRVFSSRPDGPWMAGRLDTDNGVVSFSGKVCASEGDLLEIVGKWEVHPKFGKQFQAETGLVKMNETPEALAHLLATDSRFEGLGPVRARKVVEAAMHLSRDGDFASALEEFPAEIAGQSGVKIDIVEAASNVWGENKEYFASLALLGEQGWSGAQSQRIVAKLGINAPAIIKPDPYMLIGKLARFGFKTVDAVAQKMGVKKTDQVRLNAGIAFCLTKISEEGNTWTSREGLIEHAMKELEPNTLDGEDQIRNTIDLLIEHGLIAVFLSPTGATLVADPDLAVAEFEVFNFLLDALSDDSHPMLSMDGKRAAEVTRTLNPRQFAAVKGFGHRRASIISGKAGSGKTYTMDAVCRVAEDNGIRYALCAPTGKAARKLSMATNKPASTIHRLLETMYDEDAGGFRFRRTKSNPIDAGLIIVDEVSMVDIKLMRSLLAAVPDSCRLLFVGDHHQIPSVGPGAILRDLLGAAGKVGDAIHVLNEVVRQAGPLARNTTAILDGIVVHEECPAWGISKTIRGHERGAAALAAEQVEALVTSPEPLEPFGRHLDLAWDIQVLAPMRKGPLGTYALNVHLQELRQRMLGNRIPADHKTEENKAPKPLPGDRVIWTKNDYELKLFNGTQALVMALPKGGSMKLKIEDGREVVIPPAKRFNVELSYAMTIHKAQGSEWPCVILAISSSHFNMRDRNLLYTGASRAAESLTLLGDIAGIKGFATEKRSARRQTFGAFMVHGWEPVTSASASHNP